MTDTQRTRPTYREEQIKLINECRRSGLTDADWCREHGINVSTFYNWVKKCRKTSPELVPQARYGRIGKPRPAQDVVPVTIVAEESEEDLCLESSISEKSANHSFEVFSLQIGSAELRYGNDADPVLLAKTIRLLEDYIC